jgi:hypothetical protein
MEELKTIINSYIQFIEIENKKRDERIEKEGYDFSEPYKPTFENFIYWVSYLQPIDKEKQEEILSELTDGK